MLFRSGPTRVFSDEGIYIKSTTQYGNTQEDQIVKYYKEKLILPKALYPISHDKEITKGMDRLIYFDTGKIVKDVKMQ